MSQTFFEKRSHAPSSCRTTSTSFRRPSRRPQRNSGRALTIAFSRSEPEEAAFEDSRNVPRRVPTNAAEAKTTPCSVGCRRRPSRSGATRRAAARRRVHRCGAEETPSKSSGLPYPRSPRARAGTRRSGDGCSPSTNTRAPQRVRRTGPQEQAAPPFTFASGAIAMCALGVFAVGAELQVGQLPSWLPF